MERRRRQKGDREGTEGGGGILYWKMALKGEEKTNCALFSVFCVLAKKTACRNKLRDKKTNRVWRWNRRERGSKKASNGNERNKYCNWDSASGRIGEKKANEGGRAVTGSPFLAKGLEKKNGREGGT